MNTKTSSVRNVLLATALSGIAFTGITSTSAEAQPKVEIRFGGPRIETVRVDRMKFLATRLADRAQAAVGEVSQVSRRDRGARMVAQRMARFANQAATFRARLDRYDTSPWDVRRELADLQRQAAVVTSSIERVSVSEEALDNWRGTERLLGRMDRIAQGNDDREDSHSFWGR